MDCNHMRSGSSKNCIFCGKFCSRSSFFGRKAPPKRTYADELKESLQYFAAATALFGGDEDKDSDEQDETPSPPKVMKVSELPQKNSLSKKQAVPPKEKAPSKQKAVPHKKNGPSKQQAVPQKQTVPSKQRDDSKKSRS